MRPGRIRVAAAAAHAAAALPRRFAARLRGRRLAPADGAGGRGGRGRRRAAARERLRAGGRQLRGGAAADGGGAVGGRGAPDGGESRGRRFAAALRRSQAWRLRVC